MITNILNIAMHECESPTVLGWMLWRWQLDDMAKLAIITYKGDGKALDNRIRVGLANARKAMKQRGERDYKRFGYESQVGEWTLLDGTTYDVLYVSRFVTQRHTFSEVLSDLGV